MELSGSQEKHITMPTYNPIHESSSRVKMLTGNGGRFGGAVDGNGVAAPDPEVKKPEPSIKKTLRYRECLKNYAASIGGHVLDGCGEFMPSGEDGTLEALKCAACSCHRNFHRREVEGEPPCYCFSPRKDKKRLNPLVLAPHIPLALPSNSNVRPSPQMIMAVSSAYSESADQKFAMPDSALPHPLFAHPPMSLPMTTKRFRTKFTTEQKDKMLEFAEKVGWRLQKHDEVAVQQFCTNVGVKRHVLKVWMHNNKNTIGKKLFRFSESFHPGSDAA